MRRVAHATGQERGGLLLLTPDEDRIVRIIIEIPYGFIEFVLEPSRPDTFSMMRYMGFPA